MINFFNNSRTFQLSRYFSIASLVTIIVAALLLSWMYRLLAIEDLTRAGRNVWTAFRLGRALTMPIAGPLTQSPLNPRNAELKQ